MADVRDSPERQSTATQELAPFLEGANRALLDLLVRHGVTSVAMYQGGAGFMTATYPIAAVEIDGAVLFADLPGYSEATAGLQPAEAAAFANWFLAWVEGEAGRHDYFGGIVDKFIGDAVMVVFVRGEGRLDPAEAALRMAQAILRDDQLGFAPAIGVAFGRIALSIVGTNRSGTVSTMGHTVNLASRCVKGAPGVRVATEHRNAVAAVFSEDIWLVDGPKLERMKGVGPQYIVQVRRIGRRPRRWKISRDQILEIVRRQIRDQRGQGRVRSV